MPPSRYLNSELTRHHHSRCYVDPGIGYSANQHLLLLYHILLNTRDEISYSNKEDDSRNNEDINTNIISLPT